MRKSAGMPKKMKPGMHMMEGGMPMKDSAMNKMMKPPMKKKGGKVKKGY